MKKGKTKPKKTKDKKKGILHYLNFKNIQTEIVGYGYEYSLKQYVITLVAALAAMLAGCRFFHLLPVYTVIVLAIFICCLPIIIISQKRFLFEQKRFRQTVDYLEQMIYSFKKKPKILESLQDVLMLVDGEMEECIQGAIDAIERGVEYKDALAIIEASYGCSRMRILHDFIIKVEAQGGHYQETLNVILSDIQSWTERTYSFQKDRSKVKVNIIMSLVMGAIVGSTTIILLMANKSLAIILTMPVSQFFSFLLIAGLILVFMFSLKKLTGSWLETFQEPNKKQIDRDWHSVKHPKTFKQNLISTLIAAAICSPVVIVGFVMGNKILLIVGAIIEIIVVTVPKRGGGSAKKRLMRECEKEFPIWIRGIALDLQTDNVYVSIRNSMPTAPYVFKDELATFVDELEKDPTSILPYQHFLEDLELPELQSIVKMLYSLTNLGNEDAETQINSLIMRNNALIEKAERIRDADQVKLVKQITWLPMLMGIIKIFVDMFLLMASLFSNLSSTL